MSEHLRRLLSAAAVLVLCSVATACARPIGDLGRAREGLVHDEIMPGAGRLRATIAREPISRFNLTDEEEEMHDRVWRFLTAPHADGWFMNAVIELQRTRIVGLESDRMFRPESYYRWLHRTRYESSRVRFNTIADDARTDVETAPSTFRSICRVLEVDRQRALASRELKGIAYDEVVARRAENEMFIAWFTRAIRYRYQSYGYALDHLLVETPHEEAIKADAELSELGIYVDRADLGDFCLDGDAIGGGEDGGRIPSRLLIGPDNEGDYLK